MNIQDLVSEVVDLDKGKSNCSNMGRMEFAALATVILEARKAETLERIATALEAITQDGLEITTHEGRHRG